MGEADTSEGVEGTGETHANSGRTCEEHLQQRLPGTPAREK